MIVEPKLPSTKPIPKLLTIKALIIAINFHPECGVLLASLLPDFAYHPAYLNFKKKLLIKRYMTIHWYSKKLSTKAANDAFRPITYGSMFDEVYELCTELSVFLSYPTQANLNNIKAVLIYLTPRLERYVNQLEKSWKNLREIRAEIKLAIRDYCYQAIVDCGLEKRDEVLALLDRCLLLTKPIYASLLKLVSVFDWGTKRDSRTITDSAEAAP